MDLELGVKDLTLQEPDVTQPGRRMITVQYGCHTKNFWINGVIEAMRVIKSVFGIRSERALWLEDEKQIVCPIDRCVHLGNYTLRIQEGIFIKVQLTFDINRTPVTKTLIGLCVEEDFENFLTRRGWICLVECEGSGRMVFNLDGLQHGALYRGCETLEHSHHC